MIKIYQKKIHDSVINEIDKIKNGCWIHVKNINDEDIKFLEKELKIDNVALTDAQDPYEVPRVESHENITYIFTRTPQRIDEKIITTPLLITVGQNFVLTVSKDDNPVFKKFINNEINFTTTQKSQLVLKFLSEIVKDYNGFLSTITKDVRGTTKRVDTINEKVIINFVSFEEILNDFLSALTHTKHALQKIINGKLLQLYKEDQELIEDLVFSTDQLVELSNSTLKNIVNIRKGYSTIITNNLNKVIKLFTALTVILTIPTIITSFYGMNVRLPYSENPLAYLMVILGTVAIVSFVFWIFSRNKWL